MTQREFEERVKMTISSEEFDAVNLVYMNSDVDKDEFCKMWVKMNSNRIQTYKENEKERKEKEMLLDNISNIILKKFRSNFDWRKDAKDNLTDKEIGILARCGINISSTDPYGVTIYKPTYDVWYEMDKLFV